MAKISPVSIKYMIHAKFRVEGALEKPDVIGAVFGQTEGLLGNDLEMRELQKEGKIGRIEVELERKDKVTSGTIQIPTALDQSETTLIAAAVETIEKMGPCDAQIEVERIEDVRGSKRDYIIERAKKLMAEISGQTDSREISKEIKDSTRTSEVTEYGPEKLPAGDLSEDEVIVVEGRADVLNLLRAGVKNVIAMNGTKLPDSVRKLSESKDLTLFVDGDRGGKLIIQNVLDNARIKYITMAPDGKEVEELAPKEILMYLRKKESVEDYLSREKRGARGQRGYGSSASPDAEQSYSQPKTEEVSGSIKEDIREFASRVKGSGMAVALNARAEEMKTFSAKTAASGITRLRNRPYALIVDGPATNSIIESAEEMGVRVLVAKTFTTTDTKIELMGF